MTLDLVSYTRLCSGLKILEVKFNVQRFENSRSELDLRRTNTSRTMLWKLGSLAHEAGA